MADLPPGGLLVLFEGGERPDCARMRQAVSRLDRVSISHDPTLVAADKDIGSLLAGAREPSEGAGEENAWLELLIDGLTFDLMGLQPGPGLALPSAIHRFAIADTFDVESAECLGLGAGPHLMGAQATMPVIRALLDLTCDLMSQFINAQAVYWHPSRSLIGRDYFTRIVRDWLAGGAFPALGLTAFARCDDGDLQSEGLSFFTGQELRIKSDIAMDMTSATRLAIRLVHHLVAHGTLERSEHVMAPDGSGLLLSPSDDGRIVRVGNG